MKLFFSILCLSLISIISYGQGDEKCQKEKEVGRKSAFNDHQTFGYIYSESSNHELLMPIGMLRIFMEIINKDSVLIMTESCLTSQCEWEAYKEVTDSIFYSKFGKKYLKIKAKEAKVIWQKEVLKKGFTESSNCKQKIEFQIYKGWGGNVTVRYLAENKPTRAKYSFNSAGFAYSSQMSWTSYINEEGIVDSLNFNRCFYKFEESQRQISELQTYIESMYIGKKLYNPCKFCGKSVRTEILGNVGVKWLE